MQSNVFKRTVSPFSSKLISATGSLTQIRSHVKIYPWRYNRTKRECYLDKTRTPYTDRLNMNEFDINHKKELKPWQRVICKDKDNRFNVYNQDDSLESDPVQANETARAKMQRLSDSLHQRGAARETRPYDPPEGVQDRILQLFKKSLIEQSEGKSFTSDKDILEFNLDQAKAIKFNLISKCIEEFGHDLPTSCLNEMSTITDVVNYFSTPVRGIDPYSSLVRQANSLPVNLSILPEFIRFDKETDQFFQGKTAYPGMVNKVPGIRGSRKYPILNQDEFQWPDI